MRFPDEQARRAYLGFSKSVGKSLLLSFAGFNGATGATIPVQSATGDVAGMMTISGQVDQGASADKGMRLRMGMTSYSDGAIAVPGDDGAVGITYQTSTIAALQPELRLSLRNIPNGTFTGSLLGSFQMTGDLQGEVRLNLSMSGEIEDDGAGEVQRTAGTTTVTGTATSGNSEFQVNVTL
jgi:hypothetical protein